MIERRRGSEYKRKQRGCFVCSKLSFSASSHTFTCFCVETFRVKNGLELVIVNPDIYRERNPLPAQTALLKQIRSRT